MTRKRCPKCKKVKDLGEFYFSKTSKDGRGSWCRICARAASKESTQRHRTKNTGRQRFKEWKSNLQRGYGITPEQYAEFFLRQNGLCAICGRPETMGSKKGKVYRLAVDHDHATGQVRGLLCRSCNMALGGFSTTNRLRTAIRYLENTNATS